MSLFDVIKYSDAINSIGTVKLIVDLPVSVSEKYHKFWNIMADSIFIEVSAHNPYFPYTETLQKMNSKDSIKVLKDYLTDLLYNYDSTGENK